MVAVVLLGLVAGAVMGILGYEAIQAQHEQRMAILGYEQIMDVGQTEPVWRKVNDWR